MMMLCVDRVFNKELSILLGPNLTNIVAYIHHTFTSYSIKIYEQKKALPHLLYIS